MGLQGSGGRSRSCPGSRLGFYHQRFPSREVFNWFGHFCRRCSLSDNYTRRSVSPHRPFCPAKVRSLRPALFPPFLFLEAVSCCSLHPGSLFPDCFTPFGLGRPQDDLSPDIVTVGGADLSPVFCRPAIGFVAGSRVKSAVFFSNVHFFFES